MKRPWPIIVFVVLFVLGCISGLGFTLLILIRPNAMSLPWMVPAFSVGFSIFYGLMAFGFWHLRNWARVTFIVLLVIASIGWIAALVIPIFRGMPLAGDYKTLIPLICVGGSIIWYLARSSIRKVFTASADPGIIEDGK